MVDFEEKEHLEYVLTKIKEEIIKNEEKLREVYEKSAKLTYDDKKRGEHFNVNAQAALINEYIGILKRALKVPYFGRIDFSRYGVSKIYIGKKGITSDRETLVTDWRAPISSLYYDSEIGEVQYESPQGTIHGELLLKRQINIADGKLIDFQDSSLVTNDELLKPYLSTNVDNKMKIIIASIQKEQNQIIRRPIKQNLIVQGVAGSGKTSVALHRVAYLLYELGEKISSEFLVIGPNKYFLNYVSSILPELETEPVIQKPYIDLVNELINENLSLDETIDAKNDELSRRIRNYKTSLGYKKALVAFIHDYMENAIVQEGISFYGKEMFSKEEIKSLIFREINSRPNFKMAMSYIIEKYKESYNDVYDELNKENRAIYTSLPKSDPKRLEAIKASEEMYDFFKNKGIKFIKDYFKNINEKISTVYKKFLIYAEYYLTDLTPEEINKLKEMSLPLINKKKICFEDMAALLFLNQALHGNNISYKHIVIDEAQDYGVFHFDVLKSIFPNSTFSIYGDLAQSIYSYRGVANWEEVIENVFNGDCELLNIDKSYRTTIEITINANQILNRLGLIEANPVIRHGDEVSFNNQSNSIEYKVSEINSLLEKGYKMIAVICKTVSEAKKVYNDLNKYMPVTLITDKDTQYGEGVFVLTSAASKGLEFDAVIINDASSSIYDYDNPDDMHLLYVACTRPLHKLDILYNEQLCPVFNREREAILKREKKIVKEYSVMKNVIGVVGIGYVGLPLAISFSKKYKVIAYDNDVEKINKYKKGIDVTKSNYDKEIKQSSIIFTSEYNDLKECNIYIVCVPTPITKKNKPLLSYLITATKTIGKILEKGDIVIYESTVYPGTTEEICIPILEDNSNLKLNKDFGVGFSPERINPGDTNHTFTNINKIVSASNAIYLKYIHNIYQLVMDSNIYDAPNIKTAEMSKIIENCQRDINIAFINEMSNISEKLNIDMSEVLAAAKTKWNFLDFKPGLVGGHCIGVDPYYLIYKAKKLKYNPKLLKISRKTNEDVYKRIVKNIKIILKKNNIKIKNSKILFLGVTFKENVSDVRNSKVIDMINLLKNKGADVIASDYNVCPDEFYEKNGFKLVEEIEKVDVVIIAVKHKKYMNLSSDYLNGLFRSDKKILFDIHSIYDKEEMKKKGFEVWSL